MDWWIDGLYQCIEEMHMGCQGRCTVFTQCLSTLKTSHLTACNRGDYARSRIPAVRSSLGVKSCPRALWYKARKSHMHTIYHLIPRCLFCLQSPCHSRHETKHYYFFFFILQLNMDKKMPIMFSITPHNSTLLYVKTDWTEEIQKVTMENY